MRELYVILLAAILLCNLSTEAQSNGTLKNSRRNAIISVTPAQETPAPKRVFSPTQVTEDFSIFKRALMQLHPGLERYNSPAQLERAFNEFEAKLKSPVTDGEFFKLLAQFVSKIRCGHTYLNPLNQTRSVRARFFENRTYLPFYFRLVDRRIIVTGNLSPRELTAGSEITKINGVSSGQIINQLLTVTSADGTNTMGTRLNSIEIEITRENVYQLFDIYFPLFFPLKDELYEIEAVERATKRRVKFRVPALTRAERFAETERRYGKLPTYEDGWRFEIIGKTTAYLKIPHSLTWRLKKIDFRKFIADAFAETRARKIRTLIIDWRGNDGGDEAVGMLVASYLAARPIDCYDKKVRFIKSTRVDADLFKHLTFYDEELKQGLQNGLSSSQFQPGGNNLFRVLRDPKCRPLPPQANNFQGAAFIIADASNVSASFQFLRAVRENRLATIVGQTSGGNLQGINGDSYALLSLPNSRFEIDIPLYFQAPPVPQPDAGIIPDYIIKPTVQQIAAGIDAELNYILQRKIHGTRPAALTHVSP